MTRSIWNRPDTSGKPFKGKQSENSKRADAQALAIQNAKTPSAQKAAREVLVRSFKPLMTTIANRYAKRNDTEFDDVFQDVAGGLLRASEKWRPTGGVCFLTFAMNWMHALANRQGMSHFKGNVVRGKWRAALSLDAPMGSDADSDLTLADVLPSEGESPFEAAERAEQINAARAAVKRLPRAFREVIEARTFGEQTLETVGNARGVSRERIRQVEMVARERMRRGLSERGFGPPLPAEESAEPERPALGYVAFRRPDDPIGRKLYRRLRSSGVHALEARKLVAEALRARPQAA